MSVAALRSELRSLRQELAALPPRQTSRDVLTSRVRWVYGYTTHPAAVRVLADPDNPALLRDLAIDNEWDRLYLHDDDAPEGVLPTNGHSLTMAQRYKIISTRVWLYKADDDWPDQRIGADFPFSRQPGETCTQAMRRHFEDADTEDVERDDGPGLNGPLLLPGERWPTTWEQAYWLAGQEDGLYMGQRGLDNHRSTRQAIRAQAGIVEARGFGAEWTTVGTIKR